MRWSLKQLKALTRARCNGRKHSEAQDKQRLLLEEKKLTMQDKCIVRETKRAYIVSGQACSNTTSSHCHCRVLTDQNLETDIITHRDPSTYYYTCRAPTMCRLTHQICAACDTLVASSPLTRCSLLSYVFSCQDPLVEREYLSDCAYCTPKPIECFADREVRQVAKLLLRGVPCEGEGSLMQEFAQTPNADVVVDVGRLWMECKGWIAERRWDLEADGGNGSVERKGGDDEEVDEEGYVFLSRERRRAFNGKDNIWLHPAIEAWNVEDSLEKDGYATRPGSVLSLSSADLLDRDRSRETLEDTRKAFEVEEDELLHGSATLELRSRDIVDVANTTQPFRCLARR